MSTQTVDAVDHKLLVAGEWVETGEWGEVKSPYDGSPVGESRSATKPRSSARSPRRTRLSFPPTSPSTSAPPPCDRAAELVGERIEDLALTIAAEAGKPIKTATVEAQRCVDTLTFAASRRAS